MMVGAQSFAALRASNGSESLFSSWTRLWYTVRQRTLGVVLDRKRAQCGFVAQCRQNLESRTIANTFTDKIRVGMKIQHRLTTQFSSCPPNSQVFVSTY